MTQPVYTFTFVTVSIVAILFSCSQASSLNGRTEIEKDANQQAESKRETPAARKAKIQEAESIIKQLQATQWRAEANHWVMLLKQLVDIGPAAVDPICKALRATEVDFELRAYGFALRAIGDPRAVQALIESLPKTLLPPGSDMGMRVDDEQLMTFMRENDLDEDDRLPKTFGFARPVHEINGAIVKLTDHKIGGDEISSIFLDGGPLQIYMRRKLYYDHTVKWRQWWAKNYESRGVEMDYVDIELAKFEFKKPKAINEFKNPGVQTTGRRRGYSLEPFVSAKRICLYDLDTGRHSKLPTQFTADSSIDDISKWARGEGFDMMGVPLLTADKSQPECALKSLGMKAWQNPAARYQTIEKEIGKKKIQMGTLATEYLAHFDEESKEYDADREVTFLFQTEEGTCGALRVICQVTELTTAEDYGKRIGEIPDHRGSVLGVKFEMKLFVTK